MAHFLFVVYICFIRLLISINDNTIYLQSIDYIIYLSCLNLVQSGAKSRQMGFRRGCQQSYQQLFPQVCGMYLQVLVSKKKIEL